MRGDALTPAASLTGFHAVPPAPANDARFDDVAELTRQLSAGNEAAFREFHTRYFDRLYHFLLIVTRGEEHAAREALQETLLRVARHAREFESDEIFWSWLKVVARNVSRDGGRKQRRYRALLDKFAFSRGPTEAQPETADERLRGLLEDALMKIEPTDRALIEGKYLRGASLLELSLETGLSEKAVESRLLRLRRQLSERLLKQVRTS